MMFTWYSKVLYGNIMIHDYASERFMVKLWIGMFMFWIKIVAWWQLKGNGCVFPLKKGFISAWKFYYKRPMFGQSSASFFHWSHSLFFFLPWKTEKIILHPKTEGKGGKASGNNQDLIVEAYCKSAKNLTAALVRSAWAAGWGLHRGEWHQEYSLLCAREKHTVRIQSKNQH